MELTAKHIFVLNFIYEQVYLNQRNEPFPVQILFEFETEGWLYYSKAVQELSKLGFILHSKKKIKGYEMDVYTLDDSALQKIGKPKLDLGYSIKSSRLNYDLAKNSYKISLNFHNKAKTSFTILSKEIVEITNFQNDNSISFETKFFEWLKINKPEPYELILKVP